MQQAKLLHEGMDCMVPYEDMDYVTSTMMIHDQLNYILYKNLCNQNVLWITYFKVHIQLSLVHLDT